MAPCQPASGAVRDQTTRDVKKSSGETAPGRRFHELSPRATALESHLGVGARGGGRLACRSGACHGGTRANSFCPRTFSWSQWGCEVVTAFTEGQALLPVHMGCLSETS